VRIYGRAQYQGHSSKRLALAVHAAYTLIFMNLRPRVSHCISRTHDCLVTNVALEWMSDYNYNYHHENGRRDECRVK